MLITLIPKGGINLLFIFFFLSIGILSLFFLNLFIDIVIHRICVPAMFIERFLVGASSHGCQSGLDQLYWMLHFIRTQVVDETVQLFRGRGQSKRDRFSRKKFKKM